jgi:hypothetical protein
VVAQCAVAVTSDDAPRSASLASACTNRKALRPSAAHTQMCGLRRIIWLSRRTCTSTARKKEAWCKIGRKLSALSILWDFWTAAVVLERHKLVS